MMNRVSDPARSATILVGEKSPAALFASAPEAFPYTPPKGAAFGGEKRAG
jgi:hypothetical protein